MVLKVQMDHLTAPASRFKSVASQVIASLSPNFLLLDLAMAISFPTIALPILLNAREGLSLNDVQASWFESDWNGTTIMSVTLPPSIVCSLSSLTQPFGAFLSGPIVDYLGRRTANFVVSLPHIIAWILIYFASDLPTLFLANALLGLGTGIMEAPINAYVGEISEPLIRGSLSTFTQLFYSTGIFAIYFLGALVDWRSAALISLAVPISSMALVLLVPETPVWLLSRGREKDALNSLCKLRGWTTPEHVREEFDQLIDYSKKLQNCVICYELHKLETKNCEHAVMNPIKRAMYKFRYVMLGKGTLRPLCFVMIYFMFYVMSGLTPIKPNMVNICGAFGMAQDGNTIILYVGIITICASVLVISLIRKVGKRKMAITSILGTAVSCTALSIYAKNHLADTVFSYDVSTFPIERSYIPLILFYLMTIFTGFNLPWVLVGEVFPFRSRACAQGVAAASNYVFTFLGTKTLLDLEIHGGLWGTFAVFAVFGYVGTIFLYFFLPETEGVSLENIETFYNGDKIQTFANDPVINTFKRLKRKIVTK